MIDLVEDELVLHGRIMPASNATFVGEIGQVRVVYKPIAGERPLWDFPDGTLADREVAAYLVSQAVGWNVVPETWLREGPHGLGMVQRWQEPDEDQEAVTLVPEGQVPPGYRRVFDGLDGHDQPVSLVHEDSAPLRRMAVFDVLVNNADRKGGHVLEMTDGHRYGVDHGVTFHTDHKLRTVLWGWLGERLTEEEVAVRRAPPGRPARRPGRRAGLPPDRARDRRDRPPLRPAGRPGRDAHPAGRVAGHPVAALLSTGG